MHAVKSAALTMTWEVILGEARAQNAGRSGRIHE
jgi:hypothetical protein